MCIVPQVLRLHFNFLSGKMKIIIGVRHGEGDVRWGVELHKTGPWPTIIVQHVPHSLQSISFVIQTYKLFTSSYVVLHVHLWFFMLSLGTMDQTIPRYLFIKYITKMMSGLKSRIRSRIWTKDIHKMGRVWFIPLVRSISNGVAYNHWLNATCKTLRKSSAVKHFASMVLAIFVGYNLKIICY